MTNIDIEDWQGHELYEDFANYVKAIEGEARAIVARRSGSMAESIDIVKIPDGFNIGVNPSMLRTLSGKTYNYALVYHNRGYKNFPARPFMDEAVDSVDVGDKPSGNTWRAKGTVHRNGTSRAVLYPRDMRSVDSWLNNMKGRSNRIAPRVSK